MEFNAAVLFAVVTASVLSERNSEKSFHCDNAVRAQRAPLLRLESAVYKGLKNIDTAQDS